MSEKDIVLWIKINLIIRNIILASMVIVAIHMNSIINYSRLNEELNKRPSCPLKYRKTSKKGIKIAKVNKRIENTYIWTVCKILFPYNGSGETPNDELYAIASILRIWYQDINWNRRYTIVYIMGINESLIWRLFKPYPKLDAGIVLFLKDQNNILYYTLISISVSIFTLKYAQNKYARKIGVLHKNAKFVEAINSNILPDNLSNILRNHFEGSSCLEKHCMKNCNKNGFKLKKCSSKCLSHTNVIQSKQAKYMYENNTIHKLPFNNVFVWVTNIRYKKTLKELKNILNNHTNILILCTDLNFQRHKYVRRNFKIKNNICIFCGRKIENNNICHRCKKIKNMKSCNSCSTMMPQKQKNKLCKTCRKEHILRQSIEQYFLNLLCLILFCFIFFCFIFIYYSKVWINIEFNM